MIKVVSWYDNEAGYAARLADMARIVAKFPAPRKPRVKAKTKASKNGVLA